VGALLQLGVAQFLDRIAGPEPTPGGGSAAALAGAMAAALVQMVCGMAKTRSGRPEERARLDTAREGLDACQKARRRHEADLQDLEARRSKYKGQLMEVKTNKEYTAMLHEIEAVEREIRGREDQVLSEMEKAEGLTGEIEREEEAFRHAEESSQAEERALEEQAQRLEREGAALSAERETVAATVPEDALQLFQRVARIRGVAVAQVLDGVCQVCHVKLRLQMYVDLKRNEEILQCPSCSRILFFAVPLQPSPEP